MEKLKKSAKSIYNAIYSYIKGDIKTLKDLTIAIIKVFFSFTTILSSLGLETQLEIYLSPILTPVVAGFVAPVLAITAGSFAVVIGTRMIENAINYLFGIYAELQKVELIERK